MGFKVEVSVRGHLALLLFSPGDRAREHRRAAVVHLIERGGRNREDRPKNKI